MSTSPPRFAWTPRFAKEILFHSFTHFIFGRSFFENGWQTNYPAACNSVEQILIHRDAIKTILPEVIQRLVDNGVTVLVEDCLFESFRHSSQCLIRIAAEEDFHKEFLELRLAVKTVGSLDEAVAYINENGSHHTDAIITEDPVAAEAFMAGVDSAGVFWNASTRFADGFRWDDFTEARSRDPYSEWLPDMDSAQR
jgi:gamma-glutamyl phosphate reductase